ncbi:MAG TPA: hypothetical protein VGR14_20065 [Verrucomicrobiae bacterium]|nr:hypothetical protein [Verrucomicrobiae bacterium]
MLLGVLVAAFYPSASVLTPPLTLLPLSYKIVLPPTPWHEKWIPPTWGWLWRIHDSVFGRHKVTVIRAQVFEISGKMNTLQSSLALPTPPLTGPGGVCAWLVSNADWGFLLRRVESIPGESSMSAPQVTTGDRNMATISEGSVMTNGGAVVTVGLTAEFLPCAVNGMTELTFVLCQTESAIDASGSNFLRTNFAAAARLRMTVADAAVLIDAAEPQSVRTRAGLILSAQPQAH